VGKLNFSRLKRKGKARGRKREKTKAERQEAAGLPSGEHRNQTGFRESPTPTTKNPPKGTVRGQGQKKTHPARKER